MIHMFISNLKYILLVIALIIIALGKFGAKLDYLSTRDVVVNYFKCFKKRDGSRWLALPILNYTLVPILLGISAALFKSMNTEIINIITIIISILTAMLFTMLTMIIDMKAKLNSNNKYYGSEYKISKIAIIETYYVVMYEILLSVILLVFCLFCVYVSKYNLFFSCGIYSLSFLILFNLFMIIKRIFRIINADINKD